MPDPDTEALLNEYRTLWISYLPCTDARARRVLIRAMMKVREAAGMPEDAWEEFTSTLPGFDEWWLRVREEYVERLKTYLEGEE